MCTAATYQTKCHYFGRNLDLDFSYQESVTVTPRDYPFRFRLAGELRHHYAMIGMAYVLDDYPLYYDATNEAGLSMAGLNFPGNADYKPVEPGSDNVCPFEFIPWILGQCATVAQAREKLASLRLVRVPYSEQLPLSPLHWILADRVEAITVECVAEGLKIYENPVGILTNNPPFDYQMLHLTDYLGLTSSVPTNRFSKDITLEPYSLGFGGKGLPGDLSSTSRFVRAAFTKFNARSGETESESISQFFHILGSVEQVRGCAQTHGDRYETTLYTSCCNTDKGIYYYRTYENSQITGVNMYHENLDGAKLAAYPLVQGQQIRMEN